MSTQNSNLKNTSNQQLLEMTSELVKTERKVTTQILMHLKEIYERKLYATLGYPSLIEYCIKELKYSESAAYRRVQAMKLVSELPEIVQKIDQGKLNLNQLAQAQSVFQKVRRELKKSTATQEKREVLQKIEGQSFRSTEKLLFAMEPKISKSAQESSRCISSEKTQLTLVLDHDTYENLKLIQEEFMGRKNLSEIVTYLTKGHLRKRSQKKVTRRAAPTSVLNRDGKTQASRTIPRPLRRQVLERAQQSCEFLSPLTQRRCGSRAYLELDHIQDFSRTKSHDISNLQVLCFTHHQLKTQNT